MVRVAGLFSFFIREFGETFYQFQRPFVADASTFQGSFGPFEPAPHEEAIKRTAAWFGERARG
jgi:hypothetical protein